MDMKVDQAGRNHLAGAIDDLGAGARDARRVNGTNPTVFDGNVRDTVHAAGRIDHPPIF
jgi:hypothetical protein